MGNCVGSKGIKKDPKVLTEEEIKLLLDNTRLTRPQIIGLHRNFLKECPTGKLTKKDFIKLFKEVHPSENKKEKADKFCEYVFKVIDTNNLGYISFQDFVLCFSLTSDGDFRQKCEFAFKLYDLDKDGKISKKEMTQVLTALYDLSGITDRKKNNAPAKKVEEIIRKINLTNPPPQNAAPAPAAAAPAASSADDKKAAKKAEKEKKEREAAEKKAKKEREAAEKKAKKDDKSSSAPKEAKPAKEAKAPEYITKEQFIDACTTDETLKKLFVDSIFCNQGDEATNAALNNIATSTSIALDLQPGSLAKSVNVTGPSVTLPSLHVKAPSVDVKAPSVEVKAPSVDVKAPSVEAKSSAPASPASAGVSVSSEPIKLELKAPELVIGAATAGANDEPASNATTPPTSDVNGVYNIREETNYVTSYQMASPALGLSAEVKAPEVSVSVGSGEKKAEEAAPQHA